jgi:hypothetical protein
MVNLLLKNTSSGFAIQWNVFVGLSKILPFENTWHMPWRRLTQISMARTNSMTRYGPETGDGRYTYGPLLTSELTNYSHLLLRYQTKLPLSATVSPIILAFDKTSLS